MDVIDANGNYRNIGTATTDASGTFSYMWQPDIPGKYTVIATFSGTESYGSSFAETSFGVVDSPTSTPETTIQPLTASEMYFVPAIAGLFVLIIVVTIVLALLVLRKRP